MEHMSTAEIRQFLLEKARTGKLATVREDGRPHIAPIWIDLEDDTIVFTTGHDSVKATNIRRDPRVAICVDDDQPPFAFVIIEGVAALTENREELRYWATRMPAGTWARNSRRRTASGTALKASCWYEFHRPGS